MSNGTVKYFNAARGIGFITPDNGGPDIYVNAKSIDMAGFQNLEDGQRVSEGPKGAEAIRVRII